MLATDLILIRHGHTSSNGGGHVVMSGWTDLPLSPIGLCQAQHLRVRLEGEPPFAAIYASPLVRALDTARPLFDAGLGPLRVEDDLREIHCGDLEGVGVDEVKRSVPELWEANLRQDDDDFRWPGGESYRELRARVTSCLAAIRGRHEGERVAVVTHAGVISQLMGELSGAPPARWESNRPENASVTQMVFTEGSPHVARFDDRAHLAPCRRTHPPAG